MNIFKGSRGAEQDLRELPALTFMESYKTFQSQWLICIIAFQYDLH